MRALLHHQLELMRYMVLHRCRKTWHRHRLGGLLLLFFVVGLLMWIGLWIWVIVDVVQRNDDWYTHYPLR